MSTSTPITDPRLPALRVQRSGYVRLKKVADGVDGDLHIMEATRHVPFPIQRVYFINHLDERASTRGKHAHKALRQAIFCISGSFTLSLDDGTTTQDLSLAHGDLGVLLEPGLWHTMHDFSANCVLLVVASDFYQESDYLRSYDEFRAWVAAHPLPA